MGARVGAAPSTQSDTWRAAKVCLIGQTVAQDAVRRAPIRSASRSASAACRFTVIGVLESKGQSMMGPDQDDVVLMPISTARKRVLGASRCKQRSVGTIWVKVRDGDDMKAAEEQMRDLLRQRHQLHARPG